MPQSRRNAIKAMAAGAGTVSLAGCLGIGGNGGGGGGNSKEVHFITEENSAPAKEFFRTEAQKFTEETDIPVTVEFTGVGTSFDQRITTLVQTGNPPEVAQVSDFHITPWLKQGIAEPVTSVRETVEEEFGEEFGDNQRLVWDGEDYLAPLWSNLETFTYRTDLFEEAGVTPPKTWSEQLDAWETLDNSIPKDMAVGNHTGVNPYGYVSAYVRMYQNGVQEITKEENGGDPFSGFKVSVDKGKNLDRTVAALEHLNKECDYSNDPTQGTTAMISSYYTQKAAVGEYIGARPYRQAHSNAHEEVGVNSSMSVIPKGPSQDEPRYHGWHEGFAVMSNSENPEAGKQWLEHLLTGDRVFGLLTKLSPVHNLPMLDSHFDDDRYRSSEFFTKYDVPDELLDYLRDNVKPYGYSKVHEAGDTPNPHAGAILGQASAGEMARKVVMEDQSPESAVKEHAEKLRSLLKENQE